MAFINEDGKSISYECSELIEELRTDIEEFGGHTVVAVWCKEEYGVEVYTNYDFIEPEKPISEAELSEGEYLKKMTMLALLILLEKQNEII